MLTGSPSGRAIGTLLVAVLAVSVVSISTPSSTGAQQQTPLRPGQSPGPRFLVTTLSGNGDKAGFQIANAVRDRVASDFDMRSLWVVPEDIIEKGLKDSGYPIDQALSKAEVRQLSQAFRADETLLGVVSRTPSGGYRVEADWSLTRRDDMVQPLPPVEAEKISDVAKMIAREFSAARKQVEEVQRCNELARARNIAGALAAARKAIEVYPRSVLGRVCVANIYLQEKLGPDSMIRISQEILAIHPRNVRALNFVAEAYEAKGANEEYIRALGDLAKVDSVSSGTAIRLVRALAAANRFEEAVPMIDSLVRGDATNVDFLAMQWRVHVGAKDWTSALRVGRTLMELDSATATRDFFVRMVAIADAAGDAAQALELCKLGVAKFPMDDELALLHVQLLRNAGDLRGALVAVNAVIARNPKAPNVWLQKARLEADLGLPVDSVVASLRQGRENGETPAAVSRQAVSFGQTAMRDSANANKLVPPRTAIRYYKFAESVHASDTTALFLGIASLNLGQVAAIEARNTRQCDLAKESQAALVDAQISLPKAGKTFPDQVAKLLPHVPASVTYSDQVAKAVCR